MTGTIKLSVACLTMMAVCGAVRPARAQQWNPDGVALCTAANNQISPVIVSDGTGGAIVTWVDYRGGTADVYAQRVSAAGTPQWNPDGVALCTAVENQGSPTIVSDGAGGAIVTWVDYRNDIMHPDIYAQRVNAAGAPQWTLDGVALCTAANNQISPTIVSDGAAGAIVTWDDNRSGAANFHIYAQRVNAAGAPQWTVDGVALCTAANNQGPPTIVSDGVGGAIVTWDDNRGGTANFDIYAQRVNAAGAPQWTVDGVAVCAVAQEQRSPTIVSDGASGAIVTWTDFRSGNYDIYAQRVSAAGAPQWTLDGMALCTAANSQYSRTIASDGAGGAIVTWEDLRNGADDIYAQRVSAAGAPQWTVDGVALCTAANNQDSPMIVSDGGGGAIVTWRDGRNDTQDPDIYAQRVNAGGAPQWAVDGVVVCAVAQEQRSPTIASDGAGGAIVTWQDNRSGTNNDIYAQRVDRGGACQGVGLCTAANNQNSPTIVLDGAGGAIVTWQDDRSGSSDIYAQRVDVTGTPQWTPDGVALCTAANYQFSPTIVSDGLGGAIVTWHDIRSSGTNYDIYAQRVNAAGTPQWTFDGVALCTAVREQTSPTIVSDGEGGAIATWEDYRTGAGSDIFAQRVNAAGVPQWTPDGVVLCTAANYQSSPTIVTDGAGGAIVTWYDIRGGTNYDIYAQRVNAAGTPQWTLDGVVLCTATNNQFSPTIVSDGAGGAIVTWRDYRSNTTYDIYAQRVNAGGAAQWTLDGVALCAAVNDQVSPTIVSDGSGGAIVTWDDNRSGTTNFDIYAQRVNAAGVPQWTLDGVALCTAANNQDSPTIASDGADGAIVTWQDLRSGADDIYAQRVNAAGAPQWTLDGVALCTAANSQNFPTIVSDGSGGAILAWSDRRSGTNYDIYADVITSNGNRLAISPEFGNFGSSVAISGRDFDAQTTVRFNGTLAYVTVNSATSITATVPQATTAGPIGVDGACGSHTSVDYFYPPGWPFCGVPVSPTLSQESQVEVSDGAGGVIVAWQGYGTGYDLYAQRMNPNGQPLWPQPGVALCAVADDQISPTIVSDGAGGAIVTWQDRRGSTYYDIYAQRVDAAGTPQWTSSGVALCTAGFDQESPTIVSDGAGGAIVTWQDRRFGTWDVYVQRVNAAGAPQWTANGVGLVIVSLSDQFSPKIASDGAGGAIVTWRDSRGDIFARAVNAAGTPQWTTGGVALCTAPDLQLSPTIVSDGAGGAIVTWQDRRNGTFNNDIYARRVSAAGVPQWAANGVALCAAASDQLAPKIAADEAGGAIVTWYDYRTPGNADIYAQRVNGAGTMQWLANGVALRIDPDIPQQYPTILSDGAGGAMVTWQSLYGEIYTQWVTGAGAPQWTAGGVLLCNNGSFDANPVIALDGTGGAIVSFRNGSGGVDAVRVNSGGQIPVTGVGPLASELAPPRAWPNPFRDQVSIAFSLTAPAPVRLEVFDVAGRRVWASPARPLESGRHTLVWNGRTEAGTSARGGIYFLRARGPQVAVSRTVVCVK